MTKPGPAPKSIGRSASTPWWVYAIAVLPPLLLCSAVLLQPWIPPADLFRDPLSVAHDAAAKGECCHAYYGFISLLGGLLWSAAAAIALFAATVLFTRQTAPTAQRFLLSAGLLTGMLMIDDVFQGHEFVYPTLFGISEPVTVGVYAVLLASHLWYFRQRIIEVGPGLLVVALVAFAVSVLTDLFVSHEVVWQRGGEDGSKLLGISSWTAFHWRAALYYTAADRSALSSE